MNFYKLGENFECIDEVDGTGKLYYKGVYLFDVTHPDWDVSLAYSDLLFITMRERGFKEELPELPVWHHFKNKAVKKKTREKSAFLEARSK